MSARLGRRPDPNTWPRNSPAYHAAKRVVYALAGLTAATSTLTTKRPTVAQAFDLLDRADTLARAIQVLTLVEGEAAPPPRTAAAIAAEVAAHGRAIASITSGYRTFVPDLATLSGARRLSTALCRSIAALEAIERKNNNMEFPDETKS